MLLAHLLPQGGRKSCQCFTKTLSFEQNLFAKTQFFVPVTGIAKAYGVIGLKLTGEKRDYCPAKYGVLST